MPTPLGRPLQLTDKQLEQMAQVTEADIIKAKQLVRSASPLLADILDAEILEDQNAQRQNQGAASTK